MASVPQGMARRPEISYLSPMRIYKDFLFEAAHYLPSAPIGHPNSRVHGHSFRARVVVDGQPDAKSGLVFHFDDLTAAIEDARDALDHRLLNEIEGLEAPTLERISIWLWNRLQNRVPGLAEIQVSRDSCHEGCIYRGDAPDLRQAAE
ncbi:MAG TPA: 6-carboxytetrahydropterin synthase [Hyphomicrobium sp.]|nr:6-carboxytetrahydropterin synthase [Hyphomicrobium sp.]